MGAIIMLSLCCSRSLLSQRKSLYPSSTLSFVSATQRTHPVIAWLWCKWDLWSVAKKETFLNWLLPQGAVQREQAETLFSQSSPERWIFAYFKSCWLRVRIPVILNLRTEWEPHFWDTDSSWHALNYWEPLKNKVGCFNNHKDLKDNQELGQG